MEISLILYIGKFIETTYKVSKKTKLKCLILLCEKIYKFKNFLILKFLNNNLDRKILSFGNNETKTKQIIWVCWFQGENQAPPIVKTCINSIKDHSNGWDVVIITKENMLNYVNIDERILKKWESGTISNTSFSDLLRVNLLAQNGGFWMDATIFLTKDMMPIEYYGSFFSLKSDDFPINPITMGFWSGYYIFSTKGNIIVEQWAEYFNKYYIKFNQPVDYFLVDYLLLLTLSNLDLLSFFQTKSINGNGRFLLQAMLNQPATQENIKLILDDKQGVHKVTYKKKYKLEVNNIKTMYYYFFKK